MKPYRNRLLSTTYLSLAVGVGALALGTPAGIGCWARGRDGLRRLQSI